MRTTLNIDHKLLAEAQRVTGVSEKRPRRCVRAHTARLISEMQ